MFEGSRAASRWCRSSLMEDRPSQTGPVNQCLRGGPSGPPPPPVDPPVRGEWILPLGTTDARSSRSSWKSVIPIPPPDSCRWCHFSAVSPHASAANFPIWLKPHFCSAAAQSITPDLRGSHVVVTQARLLRASRIGSAETHISINFCPPLLPPPSVYTCLLNRGGTMKNLILFSGFSLYLSNSNVNEASSPPKTRAPRPSCSPAGGAGRPERKRSRREKQRRFHLPSASIFVSTPPPNTTSTKPR